MPKKCSICKNQRELKLFGRNKNAKDGLDNRCKLCRSKEKQNLQYKKDWYIKNRSKFLEKSKIWVQNHKEQVKEYKAQWYQDNKDRYSIIGKQKHLDKQQTKYQKHLANKKQESQQINDDLIGSQINNWIVQSLEPPYKNYICLCKCGRLELVGQKQLVLGSKKACTQCEPKYSGPVPLTYAADIQHGAITRELDFEITLDDMNALWERQNGKCALTGLNLVLHKNHRDRTASLDRIDSQKGYIKGNIQWVHKIINEFKLDLPDEYFLYLCFLVTHYYIMGESYEK